MRKLAIGLAVLGLAGCSLYGFDREEAAPAPQGFCTPKADRLPCRSGVAEGVPYSFQIYTHCGLGWSVYFDGRYWAVDGREPSGWGNSVVGTMTLASREAAVFLSDAGREAHFEPAPPSYRPPGCA
jgi:hypothetical protein